MKHETIIKTELLRERAINLVGIIPLDKTHVVIIKPHSETLSQRQRALYFQWVGIMAQYIGDEKPELHATLKEQFLVPLLIEHDEGYREMTDAVIAVRRENPALADTLKKEIVRLTSVRDEALVTKSIMSEYMTAVERHSNKLGCFLPRPGDE